MHLSLFNLFSIFWCHISFTSRVSQFYHICDLDADILARLGMVTGVNPLGLTHPNPCPPVRNPPAKKPMTRHGHNFTPKPMPARVLSDPRVTHAWQPKTNSRLFVVQGSRRTAGSWEYTEDETIYKHNITYTSPHFHDRQRQAKSNSQQKRGITTLYKSASSL